MEAKKCDHTGKFTGIGQTSLVAEERVLIVTSVVCGECGQVTIGTQALTAVKKSPISLPQMTVKNNIKS